MPRVRLALCLLVLAAMAVTAALVVPHSPDALRALVGHAGLAGVALAVGGGALLTMAMFPGAVLATAIGAVFGPVLGIAVALAAQTLGAVLAALAARRGARGAMERTAGPRLRRLSERTQAGGILPIAALRAAPGVPAGALHYLLGVSRAPLGKVAAGLALGALPRVAGYGLLGGGLAHLGSPAGIAGIVLLLGTSVAGAAVGAVRLRRSRRAAAPAGA